MFTGKPYFSFPGWRSRTFGYRGDGHVGRASIDRLWGPTFSKGDTIGCGINFRNRACFYTKNGAYIGRAFSHVPANLCPAIGLCTAGGIVDTNFGKRPFKFDIEGYMLQSQSPRTLSEVRA